MKLWKQLGTTNQIMIMLVVGVVVGLSVGEAVAPIKMVGDVFLRLIQMSVVLLVMGAVVEAVGSLSPKDLGKLGVKSLAWFMFSTVIAAAVGIIFSLLLNPGKGLTLDTQTSNAISVPDTTINDLVVDFFPTNVIKSMAEGNMIQVIIFAILFGIALSFIQKEQGNSKLLDLLKEFNKIIIQMVTFIMVLAPFGVFALITWVTGTIGVKVILPLGKFLLTFGLATVFFLVIWFIFVGLYVKVSPLLIFKRMKRILIVAFTTTSSAIALPVEMEDAELKLGISKRISKLVLPLGLALNSNGLATFLAVACITLSQVYGLPINLSTIISIVLLSTLATLGTVVVPGGGLVALAIVVPSMGIPVEGIALLAGIDWFSGMFRTLSNVAGDTTIALMIAKDENEIDRNILS
ncbi:dicarboxylate/amino acid:cation symporter [Vagococcus sp. BWB3-3]|uniref:Dicarboxylate/amino acid:cation symporter n=1 Tax=Vagococcus allomyrinae TaxID=2794353 RepID=A0A940P9V7_9ENTE|nr:dicarboxylate/amino acid:cation symporter [Vagococcus allomyrinae]MBP1040795.1 dicarboxylate/amino acid:cation symporter [Vagococcus allomyrinae]